MKFGILTAALLSVAAAPAMAEGWMPEMPSMPKETYATVKGGWAMQDDQKFAGNKAKIDNGYLASGAVGATVYPNVRAEVEALYTKADVSSINSRKAGGNSELYAGMVNGYYDFKNSTAFTPYVGAGIGYGKLKMNDYTNGSVAINADDSVMAYQAMAGVGYELNPCWTLTGEYRYIGTTDADVRTRSGVNTHADFESHNLVAGLKYSF